MFSASCCKAELHRGRGKCWNSTPLAPPPTRDTPILQPRRSLFLGLSGRCFGEEASGGTLGGMIEAIGSLLPLINDDTVVVPGHGGMAGRDGLLEFVDMLRTIEGRIRPLVAANLNVAEIIAAAPTAEFDRRWGVGYVTGEHFTRMILAGLGLTEIPAIADPARCNRGSLSAQIEEA
jgi:hypothetical protein